MSESEDHSGREPICECDAPERDDIGVGPIELTVCTDCDGVIRDE
jgi:hypothetical protein